MPSLIWSEQALRDVQRLYRFLAPKSQSASERAVRKIQAGVKVLALQSQIGRPVADMDAAFREWMIDFGESGYIVRYRVSGDQRHVILLAIRHQREAGYSTEL
jgi:plasmid stabilization system protein ParE